jgi:SAM-dependent methyltransferase
LKRFGYLRDPLFLACCALYAANRWLIKPHVHLAFFHNWFNDTLLIPCALPPLLWAHDLLGIRTHDARPSGWEIAGHFLGWSVLFEVIGPHIMRTTGDPLDVVAYAGGGLFAFGWWRCAGLGEGSSQPAGFDWLAPHYRWMEWILAGTKLQRCRVEFLGAVPIPRRVLLLGEGNGRFLGELLRRFPGTSVTVVDASAGMLETARARLQRQGLNPGNVEFIHADALEWQPPTAEYDLIGTCFFLDCFRPDQLARLVPRLAAAAAPGAHWLIADFRLPDSGLARWRALAILRSMYFFFRRATGLPATELTPVDPLLAQSGFTLRSRRLQDWGLLHSDCWFLANETASRQA